MTYFVARHSAENHEFLRIFEENTFFHRFRVAVGFKSWTFDEFYDAFKQTYIPISKTSSFYNKNIIWAVVRQQMNRTDPPILLKERFLLESRALMFPLYSPWSEVFDQKLQQYIEADLISYNTAFWMERTDPKINEEEKEPFAVLTLMELEAGFVICLVPLILSILVFTLEWISTLKNWLVFVCIFKQLSAMKEYKMMHKRNKKSNNHKKVREVLLHSCF